MGKHEEKLHRINRGSGCINLITGGAGFIGSHLIERLAERMDIVVIDNFDPYYDEKIKRKNLQDVAQHYKFEFKQMDIRDKDIESLDNVETIIHLAAKAGVRNSLYNPKEYMDVNINGTLNLLEKARRDDVRAFVFASSSSVYGNSYQVPFVEEQPCNKIISPYAMSKRSAEILCETYSRLYAIPTVILRFFTVYGPRQRPDMAFNKFMRKMKNNEAIDDYHNFDTRRDYTHVYDIVKGIENAFDYIKDKNKCETFNLGSEKPIVLSDVIDLIADNLGTLPKFKEASIPLGDVNQTFSSIEKAKRKFGYTPSVSIEEGIKGMVSWYETC